MKNIWTLYFLLMITTLLLASPLAYLITYYLSDSHSGQAFSTLIQNYLVAKRNPLLSSLLCIFPFLLLALLLFIMGRRKVNERLRGLLSLTGASTIFVCMFAVNLMYWPNFLPGKSYPGFPHGLELVIVPIFFAPVAMFVTVFIAWLIKRAK